MTEKHIGLLAIMASQACVAGEEESNSLNVRIRRMFNRMNLFTPGLEKVQEALKCGDVATAEAAYLDFWRTRTDRRVIWNPHFRLANLEKRTGAASDFFLTPPQTISWRDHNKLKDCIHTGAAWANDANEQTQWTLLNMANLMLEDRLVHLRMGTFLPPLEMGNPWNWDIVVNDDPYTNEFVHRHYFIPVLTQAYWLTGDDKYVEKLIKVWTDWILSADLGRKNQGLCPMYQAFIHPSAIEMSLDSRALTPKAFCLMIDYLSDNAVGWHLRGPRGGNQTIGQVNAIVSIATALTEFVDSKKWLDTALGYLMDFSNRLTYPDGGFSETTFLYSVGTALAILTGVDNLRAAGVPVPEELLSRTEKWGEYFAYNARPDWLLPWTGHGMRVDAGDLLRHLERMYPQRKDFLYYATKGREGEPPELASAWFPYAGYCSMRDRYAGDANYLFFDVGPCGTFHKNANKLMIVVAAHGRSLLEDQGIHTYTPKLPEFRTLCDYSYGHNTVIVDGKSQPLREEISTAPQTNPWMSTDVLDFNAGSYAGPYVPTDYTGPDSSEEVTDVVHQRSVVFVKPDYWIITDWLLPTSSKQPSDEAVHEAEGMSLRGGTTKQSEHSEAIPERSHIYEQLFHFVPGKMEHDPETLSVWSATPNQPNLALIPVPDPLLSLELVIGRRTPYPQGWYFPGGKPSQNPAPIPAPCVIYTKRSVPPTMFQTVLWPMKAWRMQRPKVEAFGEEGSGWIKSTLTDGRVDIYCSPKVAGMHQAGGVEFDGLAALVRLNPQGEAVAWQLVFGKHLSFQGMKLS